MLLVLTENQDSSGTKQLAWKKKFAVIIWLVILMASYLKEYNPQFLLSTGYDLASIDAGLDSKDAPILVGYRKAL